MLSLHRQSLRSYLEYNPAALNGLNVCLQLLTRSDMCMQVQNVIDMPANDELSLFEASRSASGENPSFCLLT